MNSILVVKSWFVRGVLASVLGGTAFAGGVWIAQGPASGYPWRTIQAAVDAAQQGDVLIVGTGTYAGFTIDDKSVSIAAAEGATVQVAGTIEVRDLQAHRFVLLSGISSTGNQFGKPGLLLTNNSGHVRIEGSTHVGASMGGSTYSYDACEGARLTDSTRVAMTRCVLRGGIGTGSDWMPGRGGHGVTVDDGSVLALYDCVCTGGVGGLCYESGSSRNSGGRGGDGCRIALGLFASGTSFTGGRGGDGNDHPFPGGWGGHGGDGLVVEAGAGAHLLGNTYQGGVGGNGWEDTMDGAPGVAVTGGGAILLHPGTARRLSAPTITSDEAPWTATLTGVAGDDFRLHFSHAPAFRYMNGLTGMRLGAPPYLQSFPANTTIPGSGTIAVPMPPPPMQPPIAGRMQFLQAFVADSQGTQILGSPLHKIFLDRRGLPDCNGNGILDYYDVVEGTSADVNHDLFPDSCDPDCNGNANPDWQDIQNGSSLDLDENGVPDECEIGFTYYVDASAPSGGDGSIGSPFQTILEGVQAADHGDTVVVRDGTYVGASNRDIDLGDLSIVVRSQNGPANCTLDLQGSGRAFATASTSFVATRIEGFTIRNGFHSGNGGAILSEHPGIVISNCRFIANSSGYHGGAIHCVQGIVESCEFIDNESPSSNGMGGALRFVWSTGPADFILRDCVFRSNSSGLGGAVALIGGAPVRISRCVFERNWGEHGAGAIWIGVVGGWTIDGCRIAGNSCGGMGGGIAMQDYGSTSLSSVTSTTITSNYAEEKGGGIAVMSYTNLALSNCILWGNICPLGPQLAIQQFPNDAANVTVSYCDLQGGQASVHVEWNAVLNWASGNLSADPLFFDADGPDNLPLTFPDNDYRLGAGSPCVDAGSNAAVPPDTADVDGDGDTTEPVPLDLLSRPRFRNDPTIPDTGNGTAPIVDMGAYERQSATQP